MTPISLSPTNSANSMRERDNTFSTVVEFPQKDSCRVLIVGCGSSRLGEDMMKDGWTGGITNVDYSQVVIDQMDKRCDDAMYRKIQAKLNREKREAEAKNVESSPNEETEDETNRKKKDFPPTVDAGKNPKPNASESSIPRMKFECVDVTDLPYPDSSFDLIVNKGTLDAILCSNGAITNSKRMMKECSRVLKSHGSMVVVSYGKAEDRLAYFENEEKWWNGGVKIYKVPKPNVGALVAATGSEHHRVYIATKDKC